MKFGCCVSLNDIQTAQDAGYDYIELPVGTVKPESPNTEFEPIRELIQSYDIKPEAWNCLLPGDIKVVGPEVDMYRIERYLRTAFERIEELEGEIVVFGSGAARNIPDGFSIDEAKEQLVEFVTLAGRVAGTYGITIAIEPLNKRETNIINSVIEGLEIVQAADHPFVKLLADLYHIQEENEPLQHILDAGNEIVHVHTADTGRLYPGSGNYPNKEFMQALKHVGYNDRISAECGWQDDFQTNSVKALDYLRRLDSEIHI